MAGRVIPVLWVGVVAVVLIAAVMQSLTGLPLAQRVGVAYPVLLVWAVWSAGFLFGTRRRSTTRAFFARLRRRAPGADRDQ